MGRPSSRALRRLGELYGKVIAGMMPLLPTTERPRETLAVVKYNENLLMRSCRTISLTELLN